MPTVEEILRRHVEVLAEAQAESTRKIRDLSRRNKAEAACQQWKQNHADTPGARFVPPAVFIRDNKVLSEPTADVLKQAQELERYWNTTLGPLLRQGDD